MSRLQRYLLVLLSCCLPSAALAGSCSILTPSGSTLVNFGVLTSSQAEPTDAIGLFTFSCNVSFGQLTVSYTMRIDSGLSGGFTTRQMAHPSGARLDYNLYTNPQRTQVFGDGEAGTSTVSGNCLALCTPIISVYGRMPAGQLGPAGVYEDTVIVTVEFN